MVDEGHAWQVSIWDRMADVYESEIDLRFVPVIEYLLAYAELAAGENVLDLGTGTGAVAILAADAVGSAGGITGVDISPEMLDIARRRAASVSSSNIKFAEGRAEKIPADDASVDVVLASLSLMYVIDRAAAAREIARVLRPGGRFVGAVWAGPDENDIVNFQATAGSFAPAPPVSGVGPGAMADPSPFLAELTDAGLTSRSEKEFPRFEFDDFESAWEALAGVTTASLDADVRSQAKTAVQDKMWAAPDSPRSFRNATHYLLATKPE